MALEREIEFFGRSVQGWLTEHRGKFVVLTGENVIGFFATPDEALAAGARQCGRSSFLVRRLGEAPRDITAPALTLGLLGAVIPHSA